DRTPRDRPCQVVLRYSRSKVERNSIPLNLGACPGKQYSLLSGSKTVVTRLSPPMRIENYIGNIGTSALYYGRSLLDPWLLAPPLDSSFRPSCWTADSEGTDWDDVGLAKVLSIR